ncbi:g_PROTEIN_RECEP_F1_2 domain-containing protein [Trichonephila clavata]|uniref:G_PROTEIN_RECEP_F1_2 domain-containing protein n=1 Tax=Trichonephila clavata TaxID=2740835 RepID=A0A8X6IQP7_TRICU|nr:g_PROTEIN_RECEP_F1_2 domain-containing protein [Trichonephila clavata]
MVRCLAYNDLVALLGSFLLMYMQLYMSEPLVDSRWFCALRVVLRTFGLSSGCVAIVMAAERWMALTRPFLYQKVSILYDNNMETHLKND